MSMSLPEERLEARKERLSARGFPRGGKSGVMVGQESPAFPRVDAAAEWRCRGINRRDERRRIMRRRPRSRRGFFRASVIVLGAALLAALGIHYRPDKLLDDLGVSSKGNARVASTAQTSRPSSKRENAPAHAPAAPKRSPGASSAAASIHLAMGTPTDKDPSDDTLLTKPQYALSYNQRRNVPNWVSWNLNETYFGDAPRHKGRFLTDESLPPGALRVRDQDYAGSGYDRGHMVRSEERTRTPEDNAVTFLLTNILPQRHDLNGGPWLRLEDHCQDLAQKGHRELYIMAAGVFGAHPETIGHGVAVPEACVKIVVVLDRGQGAEDVTESTRVIAVLMPNTTGILNEGWGRYRTTVREIERRTGYDFLSAVPEAIKRVLDDRIDTGPTSGF
jgi:endonuclease G